MAGLNLDDLELKVLRLGDIAVKIVKETVDKYAEEFKSDILETIPKRSGKLADSLNAVEVRKTNKKNIYGWSIVFKGVLQKKTPNTFRYNDLAFLLNYKGYINTGASNIAEIRKLGFISEATRKLKGIDNAINERWQRETR